MSSYRTKDIGPVKLAVTNHWKNVKRTEGKIPFLSMYVRYFRWTDVNWAWYVQISFFGFSFYFQLSGPKSWGLL